MGGASGRLNQLCIQEKTSVSMVHRFMLMMDSLLLSVYNKRDKIH